MERTGKPWIFATDMVRAILEDRKTETRRLDRLKYINQKPDKWRLGIWWPGGTWLDGVAVFESRETINLRIGSPYAVGSLRWVRETWQEFAGRYYYKADGHRTIWPWKPAIFMPKKAARIWLEITEAEPVRLHTITEEMARAEGCKPLGDSPVPHKAAFWKLWDGLNGKRGFPWDLNPWAWRVQFRRVA